MKMNKKLKKGFTLVELVVVIAVIAILAGVSVGAYFGITESAKNSKADQEAKALHTAIMLVVNDPESSWSLDKDQKLDKVGEKTFATELSAMYGQTLATATVKDTNVYTVNFGGNPGAIVEPNDAADKVYYITTDGELREITVKTGAISEPTTYTVEITTK